MSCSDETESEPGFARNSSLTSPAMRSASGPVWQPVRAKHFTLPSECLSHWPEVISFPSPSARARQAGKMARRAAKAAKGSRQTGLFLSLLNRACSTTAEARQSEQRQTQLRIDYDRYRRTEAERLFDKLPAGEQGKIEALARAKLSAGQHAGSDCDKGGADQAGDRFRGFHPIGSVPGIPISCYSRELRSADLAQASRRSSIRWSAKARAAR